MYNLTKVKDRYITIDDIEKEIGAYSIYAYYLGNFPIGKAINSPLSNDNTPSFNIMEHYNGALIFKDFRHGVGNFVKFVSLMEGCSYGEAFGVINHRYELGYLNAKPRHVRYNHIPKTYNVDKAPRIKSKIEIKLREWELCDKEFWTQYEISLNTLKMFSVFPIKRFYINDTVFNSEKLSYAYYFDNNTFKIYQPHSVKAKWFSNTSAIKELQGEAVMNMLLEYTSNEVLFITSSLKDVMVLHELGYPAVAPMSESSIIPMEKIESWQDHFHKIVVFYDNDETGIKNSNKLCKDYNLTSLTLEEKDTKDPSDYVKKYSLKQLKEWINEKL